MDAQIARVLDTLKQRGLLDKTVVVITAEHGVEFNDSGKGQWGRQRLQPGAAAGTVGDPLAGHPGPDHQQADRP